MKKILTLLLIVLSVLTAFADDISFKASVDRGSVAINESFVYTVTISGDAGDFPEPQISDLAAFNIFSRGKSQSLNVINGKVSGSVSYKYTLGPKSAGRFTIAPAVIRYNNRTYTTQSIDIDVLSAQNIYGGNNASQPQQVRNQINPQAQKANIFVRASTNKKTVYENEKLVYKFSFYTNIPLPSNPSPQYIPPDFSGFWNDGSEPTNRYENINGISYHVSEINTTLYPISIGTKTISAAQIKVAGLKSSASNNIDDLMQAFFAMAQSQGQTQIRVLETNPIKITVLPLPKAGRPNDFYGAVGKFKISAKVDRTDISTNEPITLTITLSGEGNMKSVTRFDIPVSSDIKKYDMVMSDEDDNKKTFTTIITALMPGEKIIPSIKLSYFNPNTKRYETANTQPIKLNVSGEAIFPNQSQNGSEFGNKTDIGYNKDIKNFNNWRRDYIKDKNFYLIFILFVLLLIGGVMFNIFGKSKASIDKAQKQIMKAEEEFKNGNLGGLFDMAYKALIEAIDSKTGVASEGLQEKQLIENLKKQNVPEETTKKLYEVFERINFYKFAAVRADEKTLQEMLTNIKEIIGKLN
ncbi:MAG: BatD family protein [Elusimicrobiota bacterium]|jgi:hypothetical protein|nr:BatD family protein [Elusimicrobiota bacterium]